MFRSFRCKSAANWIGAFFLVAVLVGVTPTGYSTPGVTREELSAEALRSGDALFARGDFKRAKLKYLYAVHVAGPSRGDLRCPALNSVGACAFHLHSYREAFKAFLKAHDEALIAKNYELAGIAELDLASVFMQMSNLAGADHAIKQAVALLQSSRRSELLINATINMGSIAIELNRIQEGTSLLDRAVKLARNARNEKLESLAWEYLGESYLKINRPVDAEGPLDHALYLRLKNREEPQVAITELNLAKLHYFTRDYNAALAILGQAGLRLRTGTIPPDEIQDLRGRILVAVGRRDEALETFLEAVRLAQAWRSEIIPGDLTSTATVANLQQVYQDYTNLAADLGIERQNTQLIRNALQVLCENRATNFREERLIAMDRHELLPSEYFELIRELQQVQVIGPEDRQLATNTKSQLIRTELDEIESKIGIRLNSGRSKPPGSLDEIQLNLSETEALFSISIDASHCFMWAITRHKVSIYRLPEQRKIKLLGEKFMNEIQSGGASTEAAEQFGRAIFGQLDSDILDKPEWLVAGSEALGGSLPLSALVVSDGIRKRYVGMLHVIRYIPCEFALADPQPSRVVSGFLGISDPIYNSADARFSRSQSGRPTNLQENTSSSSFELARLVGSDREIAAAAAASKTKPVEILSGEHASLSELAAAAKPGVRFIHFAVHGTQQPDQPGQTALVLGLRHTGGLALLTPETIRTFWVPGATVFLDGCSTRSGPVLPGEGLMGLARSWLLAGANTVIVTSWEIPDDRGKLAVAFYRYLRTLDSERHLSTSFRVALALQEAQKEMRRSGSYASASSVWAAYSVISIN